MKKVLVIAPHADDETLGVGGTIAKFVSLGYSVTVAVITGPGSKKHPVFDNDLWTPIRKEAKQVCQFLGIKLVFCNIPAVLVDEQSTWKLNQEIEIVIQKAEPDILFVPFLFDMHKDHRYIFHACSVAWRPIKPFAKNIKEIYCYETLSETHWNTPNLECNFNPNVWIDISNYLKVKLDAFSLYKSQCKAFPHPRSLEGIEALAKFRGGQISAPAAEAFCLIRSIQ